MDWVINVMIERPFDILALGVVLIKWLLRSVELCPLSLVTSWVLRHLAPFISVFEIEENSLFGKCAAFVAA